MTKAGKSATKAGPDANSFEDRFHWLLGRLVRSIASFDFNIGLQLRSVATYASRDVSKQLQARQGKLAERLEVLEELVHDVYAPAGPNALAEFRAWFVEAARARGLRNEYAHGRWGTPGGLKRDAEGRALDGQWLLAFAPLDFDMTPGRPDTSVYMTLEEFEGEVLQAERLFADFWKLSERYSRFMKVKFVL